ncbi:MAG: cation:proton antiporter [Candidatus Doudnabacteria bacterium]|nr:cation:proton antiporter [Candidatus Doudnabacteria bacterium]
MSAILERVKPYLRINVILFAGLLAFLTPQVFANTPEGAAPHAAVTFLEIALILVFAKVFSIVERWKQPAVLGELLVGVILGNLALVGIHWFDAYKVDPNLKFLAELGVAILLFRTGLESNVSEMRRVGFRAFLIALAGVVITFSLGAFVIGPWLLPSLGAAAHYFLGAALTATSVGISARVFTDLGKIKTPEAKLVVGAAVIDDVIGLVVLAVVTGLVTTGAISFGVVSLTLGKAIIFLVGAIVLGQIFAPRLSKIFSRIHAGAGTKFTLVISFCLLFGSLAEQFGLAPIIGAFAAGLVLDPIHFTSFKNARIAEELKTELEKEESGLKHKILRIVHAHEERHIDDLVEPLSHFLVPIFFVLTGMNVDVSSLFNPKVLLLAGALTAIAFIGKYCSSFFAGPGINKMVIGFGMIPRGEVQLIFAAIGKELGVVSPEVFSAIVIVVIASTIFSPILLGYALREPRAA